MISSDTLSVIAANRLSKCDRLVNRRHIRVLFQEGKVLSSCPFKVFYLKKKREQFLNHKVLFSIPKSSIRSAVQRNRIKRLLREAYRINKYMLDVNIGAPGFQFVFLIGYVYTKKKEGSCYPVVNRAVIASLYYLRALLDIE